MTAGFHKSLGVLTVADHRVKRGTNRTAGAREKGVVRKTQRAGESVCVCVCVCARARAF